MDLEKLRIPLGSLVVDASLVVALIWWGATMTARLENISERVRTVEAVKVTPETERRLSVIETREEEIYRRLENIERQNSEILVELRRRK